MDDPDDVLRANRSREKHYVFDHAFDDTTSQVNIILTIQSNRNLPQSNKIQQGEVKKHPITS